MKKNYRNCIILNFKNATSVSWKTGMSNAMHTRLLLGFSRRNSARVSRAMSSVVDLPLKF